MNKLLEMGSDISIDDDCNVQSQCNIKCSRPRRLRAPKITSEHNKCNTKKARKTESGSDDGIELSEYVLSKMYGHDEVPQQFRISQNIVMSEEETARLAEEGVAYLLEYLAAEMVKSGIAKFRTANGLKDYCNPTVLDEILDWLIDGAKIIVSGESHSVIKENVEGTSIDVPTGWTYQQIEDTKAGKTIRDYFKAAEKLIDQKLMKQCNDKSINWKIHKFVSDVNVRNNVPYINELVGTFQNENMKKANYNQIKNYSLMRELESSCSEVTGVTNSLTYFGLPFSGSPAHEEDQAMFSINMCIKGEKLWGSLPSCETNALKELLIELFGPPQENMEPDSEPCRDYFRHKAHFINPFYLRLKGFNVDWTLQEPGDQIITFPAGFHWVINLGTELTIAQAVNFAEPMWLWHGLTNPIDIFCNEFKTEVFFFNYRDLIWLLAPDKYNKFVECDLMIEFPLDPPGSEKKIAPVGPYINFETCLRHFLMSFCMMRKGDDNDNGRVEDSMHVLIPELFYYSVGTRKYHGALVFIMQYLSTVVHSLKNYDKVVYYTLALYTELARHNVSIQEEKTLEHKLNKDSAVTLALSRACAENLCSEQEKLLQDLMAEIGKKSQQLAVIKKGGDQMDNAQDCSETYLIVTCIANMIRSGWLAEDSQLLPKPLYQLVLELKEKMAVTLVKLDYQIRRPDDMLFGDLIGTDPALRLLAAVDLNDMVTRNTFDIMKRVDWFFQNFDQNGFCKSAIRTAYEFCDDALVLDMLEPLIIKYFPNARRNPAAKVFDSTISDSDFVLNVTPHNEGDFNDEMNSVDASLQDTAPGSIAPATLEVENSSSSDTAPPLFTVGIPGQPVPDCWMPIYIPIDERKGMVGYNRMAVQKHRDARRNPVAPMEDESPEETFCIPCNKDLKSAASLKRHNSVLHISDDKKQVTNRNYRCAVCKLEFNSAGIKTHMVKHSIKWESRKKPCIWFGRQTAP